MDSAPDNAVAKCLTEQQRLRHELQRLHRFLLNEARRFDLRPREQMMLETILDISYGWGLKEVKLETKRHFVDLTGMSEGNVGTVLNALVEMRILRVRDADPRGAWYSINPDTDDWRCRQRIPRLVVRRMIDTVKHENGLADPAIDPEDMRIIQQIKGDPSFFDGSRVIRFLSGQLPDLESLPNFSKPKQ